MRVCVSLCTHIRLVVGVIYYLFHNIQLKTKINVSMHMYRISHIAYPIIISVGLTEWKWLIWSNGIVSTTVVFGWILPIDLFNSLFFRLSANMIFMKMPFLRWGSEKYHFIIIIHIFHLFRLLKPQHETKC